MSFGLLPVLGRMLSRRGGEQSAGEAGRSCALAAGGGVLAPVVSLYAAAGEGVAELLLRLRRAAGHGRGRGGVSRSSGSCAWRGKQRSCCAAARGRFRRVRPDGQMPRTSSKPALFWTASAAATPPKPSSTPSSPTSASANDGSAAAAGALRRRVDAHPPHEQGRMRCVSRMGRWCA